MYLPPDRRAEALRACREADLGPHTLWLGADLNVELHNPRNVEEEGLVRGIMELMQAWHISPLDNPGPTHKGTEIHRELDVLAAD
eukprot:9911019-Prorocentrum_lima.AAC.1